MSGLIWMIKMMLKERSVECAVFYATTYGLMKRHASLGRDSVSTHPLGNYCELSRKKGPMESYSRWQRQHFSTQAGSEPASRAESLSDRTAIHLLEGTDMLIIYDPDLLT